MRETDHDVVWVGVLPASDESEEVRIVTVRCRGCGACTLRTETWSVGTSSDEYAADPQLMHVVYQPPRLWRLPPPWIGQLQELDADLKGLLDEVYLAANDYQVRLLSMGVRAALNHTMVKILEGDPGPFARKLADMVKNGHITESQKENLRIVLDAGSASTHRGFKPPLELIEGMLVVMESTIRDDYITEPMLKTARLRIPPRPSR